jgi:tetratricopeptide (TPR) repeat protein
MRISSALALIPFVLLLGCATSPPPRAQSPLIPLEKANLKLALEEQEGLAILWENARDVRDLYRGGVQHKAKAEKDFKDKKYPEALKEYDLSNDFLMTALKYIDEDSCEYPLFEGTTILFFPNLLVADNYLKVGIILKETGREDSARSKWKKALSYVQKSLQYENTEWGLGVEKEIRSLLGPR